MNDSYGATGRYLRQVTPSSPAIVGYDRGFGLVQTTTKYSNTIPTPLSLMTAWLARESDSKAGNFRNWFILTAPCRGRILPRPLINFTCQSLLGFWPNNWICPKAVSSSSVIS